MDKCTIKCVGVKNDYICCFNCEENNECEMMCSYKYGHDSNESCYDKV